VSPIAQCEDERRSRLLDAMPAIAWSASAQTFRFTYVNPAAEKLLGYPVARWLEEPDFWIKRLHPDDQHVAMLCHNETLAGRNHELEYRMIAADGRSVWLRDYVNVYRENGIPLELFGVMVDITDRVRAEEELQARGTRLQEAKRMSSLGQVAASLAHEFNNVLMGIQPFVEVIARQAPSTSTLSDALGHITRAIGRGKRASQEILRFANPKEPQLFAIDARIWLPTLLGQLAPAMPASITLTSSMEPGVRFLRGDCEHLEQVITNLVFNARDAISGPGTIHVGVGTDGEFVRISVRDNGPGIAPEIVDRIFEPLFTTKRNGTGLGLAIARRLMEGQGGTLTAENPPEGGSAFHLLVPAAAAVSPEATPHPAPVIHARPSVMRVLLVEDDPSVGAGLEVLLNSEGYETTWVRASADACPMAQRIKPHVAIIDVNLPDGNGVDLIPILRMDHKDLPVVLSTGHVELDLSSEKKRIISLMKPYELGDLLVAIENVTAAA
jgi:PAS domain S-box-containing protein